MVQRMKQGPHLSIEEIWDHLLSRDSVLIVTAFNQLSRSEKLRVIDHLQKMAREDGWQPVQQTSARTALVVIEKTKKGSES
jgi:hypothetical protein